VSLASGIAFVSAAADVTQWRFLLPCSMSIGDLVIYKDRPYVLRGLDPMGVPDGHAELEDLDSGELVLAPLAEVSPRDP
jgi:hypothetical protein